MIDEYFNKDLRGVSGKKIGIIGCGNIGSKIALNLTEQGAKVNLNRRNIKKLDTIIKDKKSLGKIGIKIDTEGYELDVILGASETLKYAKFVIAEVRHNHESLKGVYKLQEFMSLMSKNNFSLSMILTAKPFIADLCFQPSDFSD